MRYEGLGCGVALILAPAAPTPARLAQGQGDVLVQPDGGSGWLEAQPNLPLGPGDRVWVPEGWVVIQLPTGHAVRLGGGARLQIRTLPAPEGGDTELALDRGPVWVEGDGALPGGTVRIVVGPTVVSLVVAKVGLTVAEDGTVEVAVARGQARVEGPAGRLSVAAGQALRLPPGQPASLHAFQAPDEVAPSGSARDRDPSRPYLPPALAPYASELTAYGRWVSVPGQGYGWAPDVPLGWTPFSEGGWRWWRDQSVWIPDEPWGWAPSHYGRWLFVSGIGWVWLPPEERVGERILPWHPGAVGWLSGADVVGWVPLAPGESDGLDEPEPVANVTNVFVTEISLATIFVNARAPHGVVVSKKDAFVAGRRSHRGSFTSRDVFARGGRSMARLPATLRPPRAGEADRRGFPSAARGTWAPAWGPGGSFSARMPAPGGTAPRLAGSPGVASPGVTGAAAGPSAGSVPAGRGLGSAGTWRGGSMGTGIPAAPGSAGRGAGGLLGGVGSGGLVGRGGGLGGPPVP
jgi:hypothetical protein